MEVEYRKAFYHNEERLFSYPLDSETDDTQLATVEMLAYQRGCELGDIHVFLEECAPKERHFAHDCAAQRMDAGDGEERWRILNVTNGTMYSHDGPLDVFIAKYEAGEL